MRNRTVFDLLIFEVNQATAKALELESGGHRWQRIPPTERKGRVHSSTVTVAVLRLESDSKFELDMREVKVFATRDSGPGGQHRNTTDSCIVARHIPSGIEAKSAAKCQHENRRTALALLRARVEAKLRGEQKSQRDSERRQLVGSGMRADKIRTYRATDEVLICHRTNQKFRVSDFLKGVFPWM